MSKTIYVVDAERQETIIRRSSYTMERPDQDSLGNGTIITTVMDDPYDLTKSSHRRDILGRMAMAILRNDDYDFKKMDVILAEARTVIQEIKDELPF